MTYATFFDTFLACARFYLVNPKLLLNFVPSMQEDMLHKTYAELAAQQYVPLFCRAYWLEATAQGKEWDVLAVKGEKSSSEIVALLPIHLCRKAWIKMILMPQLTQTFSVVWPTGDVRGQYESSTVELLDKYCHEHHVAYCQMQGFWPEAMRQRFEQLGYSLSTRVTYRIAPGMSREQLVRSYSENKRRQLKRAVGLHLDELSVAAFYAFHSHCLQQQGKRISYTSEFAERLLGTALGHNSCRLLGAKDEEGRLLAAVGLVYDEKVCYYLLPTYDPAYSKTGAMAWLTTEAILWASAQGKIFDFEGSMVPSIARSYREFGGQPETYYLAEKFYSRLFYVLWKKIMRK